MQTRSPWLALVLGAVLAASSLQAEEARAFPEALGYGAVTPGGRGGQIIKVTTLKPYGKGSLAEALSTKGPRIIVFEVGGIIDLNGSSLKVQEPFVTIAGQTAPSPGITLIKGGLQIHANDVILTHLRIRPGEAGKAKASGWEADGVTTVGSARILIDHCSFTWATDENASTSGPRFEGATVEDWRKNTTHDVTISHSIVAECLSLSTHKKKEHSKGTLIHDNCTNVSIVRNLYASNVERNPLAKGGAAAVVVNNWIFNPQKKAIHSALAPNEWKGHEAEKIRLAIVGNVFEYGPDTQKDLALYVHNNDSAVDYYLRDNVAIDRDKKPVDQTHGKLGAPLEREPFWPAGLQALPAAEVKAYVAKNVGARPWDRDAIDARIIRQAQAGEGKIIHSEQEVGGYPTAEPTSAPFVEADWDLATMQPKKPLL